MQPNARYQHSDLHDMTTCLYEQSAFRYRCVQVIDVCHACVYMHATIQTLPEQAYEKIQMKLYEYHTVIYTETNEFPLT